MSVENPKKERLMSGDHHAAEDGRWILFHSEKQKLLFTTEEHAAERIWVFYLFI
jgi:hypothetical protein